MKSALNNRGNITLLFRGRKNIGQLLPLVEKHSKCMKFVGKNSTDFQIKEKIRLGKKFACYLLPGISVSLTFKTILNNTRDIYNIYMSLITRNLIFKQLFQLTRIIWNFVKFYKICHKSHQNFGRIEYLTFFQLHIEWCFSIQFF
jgi:hypothetical protein